MLFPGPKSHQRSLLRPDHGSPVPVAITHGLQRGKLTQVIGDVGVKDLVADDDADHKPHHGAHHENIPDGRGLPPKIDFASDDLFLGVYDDIVGQKFSELLLYDMDIGLRVNLDESQIDGAEFTMGGTEIRIERLPDPVPAAPAPEPKPSPAKKKQGDTKVIAFPTASSAEKNK